MRKVLFVHNGPLHRGSDGQMFGIHYTDAVKERYLILGDHVTFLMREERIANSIEEFSPISPLNFNFIAVPDILSPVNRIRNHDCAIRIIRNAVAEVDIVVARIPSLIARLAVQTARKLRKPYMVECVACNWDALWNHGWKGKLSAPWYVLKQKEILSQSPYVVYVTEKFLQRRYPTQGRQVAISNVDLPHTDGGVLERRLQRIQSTSTKSEPIKLITVADVAVRYKGQGDIISMLPRLAAAGIQIEYHLVGGGDPARLQLQARRSAVGSRVVFHGVLRHEQVFGLLDKMDIYVQPSRQEGLPRAVIEAMSRGLPVIGANTGGIPELLKPDRIFRAGDGKDFLACLRGILPFEAQAADARRNFFRAQDFRKQTLLNKRQAFYAAFLKENGLEEGSTSDVANETEF